MFATDVFCRSAWRVTVSYKSSGSAILLRCTLTGLSFDIDSPPLCTSHSIGYSDIRKSCNCCTAHSQYSFRLICEYKYSFLHSCLKNYLVLYPYCLLFVLHCSTIFIFTSAPRLHPCFLLCTPRKCLWHLAVLRGEHPSILAITS